MEKTTVLARLRMTVRFNEATRDWSATRPNAWYARGDGSSFLSEFGGTWESIFVDTVQPEVQQYFLDLGVPRDKLPVIRVGDRYRGSWVLEAVVAIAATIGTTFAMLKGLSELPKIADGLSDLRGRIGGRLKANLDPAVRQKLLETSSVTVRDTTIDGLPDNRTGTPQLQAFTAPDEHDVDLSDLAKPPPPAPPPPPPPPPSVIDLDFVIDARPLASLSPGLSKAHKIHLSVAVSRDSVVLENLGSDDMTDLRFGLFRTRTERHHWALQDAYVGNVPMLSGGQTISKELGEFRDRHGNRLDMSDGEEAHVDCWVQDNHGIYIFLFFLEKE